MVSAKDRRARVRARVPARARVKVGDSGLTDARIVIVRVYSGLNKASIRNVCGTVRYQYQYSRSKLQVNLCCSGTLCVMVNAIR